MDEDKKRELCLEVLKQACRKLYFELRFLEPAIFRLTPEENEEIFFGSDGKKLYYSGEFLLTRYLQSPEAVSCDYLHTVIHCLYQHPFLAHPREERYWNLAADIAVADVLGEINVTWITRQVPRECLEVADRIRPEVAVMSAQHIAAFLRDTFSEGEGLCGYRLEELEELFRRDSHEGWMNREKKAEKPEKPEESSTGESGGGETADGETAGGWQSASDHLSQMSENWKQVGEAVALNAASFSKGQGKAPASMLLTIQRLNREKYDYGEFLRKFAVMNERMKVNMDEFDYTYYLYGLHLLGKVPLIEPLEYKEELQIREFVIVIDTSGSCSGELVGRFLNKTYNILSQMECFAQQIVLHLIQCDAAVQGDVRIECAEHMEKYLERMELRGGGGTDFRPAFAYVEELRAGGELTRLGGLLYFTDGYGIFPERPPDYKTAFAFVEREDAVRVPPWAMCIYLDSETMLEE